jgi:chromosome segregation ATPase
MTGGSSADRIAHLKQAIAQSERFEREIEAKRDEILARIDAQAAEPPSQVAAAKEDMMASAASSRAYPQAVRGDMERRLAIIEARERAADGAPPDPRAERRMELQEALEDLMFSVQRLEENAESQRAQIRSMSPELVNPGADFQAAIEEMVAELESAMVDARVHFAAMQAEIERELAELAARRRRRSRFQSSSEGKGRLSSVGASLTKAMWAWTLSPCRSRHFRQK